jgi:hypothetical protein
LKSFRFFWVKRKSWGEGYKNLSLHEKRWTINRSGIF